MPDTLIYVALSSRRIGTGSRHPWNPINYIIIR